MILSVGGYNGKSGEAKHTQQIKLYFYRKQIKSKFMEHFFVCFSANIVLPYRLASIQGKE